VGTPGRVTASVEGGGSGDHMLCYRHGVASPDFRSPRHVTDSRPLLGPWCSLLSKGNMLRFSVPSARTGQWGCASLGGLR
jgi:hypothetical protein